MRCGLVAVFGRPNVGKSTLFNRLLGSRQSITTHKRNTTRFCIRGIITDADSQLILVDTPGWQSKGGTMVNRALNKSAANAISHVDAALLVVESRGLAEDDRRLVKMFPDDLKVACAINKSDLCAQEKMLPIAEELGRMRDFSAIVPVSAKSGHSIPDLEKVLRGMLPEGHKIYPDDVVSDRDESFFIAEIIREKVYLAMQDELPYAAAVDVKSVEKGAKDTVSVIADILVDSKSRQAMFVGARGAKIKEIGTRAREGLEKRLGSKVRLDLQVKVRKGWTREPATMARLGLGATR